MIKCKDKLNIDLNNLPEGFKLEKDRQRILNNPNFLELKSIEEGKNKR
ncbi:hypothetical protein HMPREF1092_01236 [Clostridium thermobutyricum]|uniref:Uncharacterized protein n=1 Tax=Clostridium thermobutyricum TaxID=29372 RepID=N9WFY4_9CLOT|nr:hypothetical protein [Clostridium thermobutyricum]ENZ02001.1 hypothetical protein HMPREF1092_01236 [Clostridium thermobutyricum]